MMNKIIIGSDHGGYEYKEIVKDHLSKLDYEIVDVGCHDKLSCDYPDIAASLASQMSDDTKGILICGTGIGISIAANKCDGIRASLCNDVYSAKMTRLHNDANVLALGQRVIGEGLMLEIVDVWLNTGFEGGRHLNRVNKINMMEEK